MEETPFRLSPQLVGYEHSRRWIGDPHPRAQGAETLRPVLRPGAASEFLACVDIAWAHCKAHHSRPALAGRRGWATGCSIGHGHSRRLSRCWLFRLHRRAADNDGSWAGKCRWTSTGLGSGWSLSPRARLMPFDKQSCKQSTWIMYGNTYNNMCLKVLIMSNTL